MKMRCHAFDGLHNNVGHPGRNKTLAGWPEM